jgi:hypothetical protein
MPRFLLAIAALAPAAVTAQTEGHADFAGYRWTTAGTVETGEYLGRQALRMRGGLAVLEGTEFSNGTIAFDIAVSGYRSFVGTSFRRNPAGTQSEFFYLRPHQSDRFDALQYTPVEHGISAWQLFPEYNAPATIPTDTWIPLRLEVQGDQLTVFMGDGADPVMRTRLATDRTAGTISLNSGVPGGSGGLAAPPGLLTTAYSNFRVTPSTAPAPATESPAKDPQAVMAWEVSEAVAGPEAPPTTLTSAMVPGGRWTPAQPDHTGRLNLARLQGIPEDANRGMVLARTTVDADRDQVKRLAIGFSDMGSVFLNGHLVYSADNTYLSRSGRYLGTMTLNDVIVLPLREGTNEIVVAVIESFGGWGVIARWVDREGLR